MATKTKRRKTPAQRARAAMSNRQTGTTSRKRDSKRSALPPGMRVVAGKGGVHTYTERRRNRSDKRGAKV